MESQKAISSNVKRRFKDDSSFWLFQKIIRDKDNNSKINNILEELKKATEWKILFSSHDLHDVTWKPPRRFKIASHILNQSSQKQQGSFAFMWM